MKNHIACKFVAITLCAAALVSILLSGAGIALLTGLGLYDKTPEQLYTEELSRKGAWFAQYAAQKYFGSTLGGCPEEFLDARFGRSSYFDTGYYGYQMLTEAGTPAPDSYTLKDAAGRPIYNGRLWAEGSTYNFPVDGYYMYLLSSREISKQIPCQGISTNTPPAVHLTYAGEQFQIEAQPYPADATDSLRFFSTDGSIAAVDENGLITAVSPGLATVIVTCGDVQTEFDVDFTPAPEAREVDPGTGLPWENAPVEEPVTEVTTPAVEANPEVQAAAADAGEDVGAEKTGESEEVAASAAKTEQIEEPVSSGAAAGSVPVPSSEPMVNGKPLSSYTVHTDEYYDPATQRNMQVEYIFVEMPAYTVELNLAPGALELDPYMPLLEALREVRGDLFTVLAVSLLVFAVLAVYLSCAAGREPGTKEVRPSGLNRLPLEIYALAVIGAFAFLIMYLLHGADYLLLQNWQVGFAAIIALTYAACLIFVGFSFALAAQVKTPDWFWFRNSLIARTFRCVVWCLEKFFRFLVWAGKSLQYKGFPFLGRAFRALRKNTRLSLQWLRRWGIYFFRLLAKWTKALFRLLSRWCQKLWSILAAAAGFLLKTVQGFLGMLPLTWQWLLTGMTMLLILVVAVLTRSELMVLLAVFADILIVLYGAGAFGILLKNARRMSQGDLDAQIDDNRLVGCFRDFAGSLNDLANVAVVAARKQLKSERMKTELITNVSHDIKTPLTSIINYTDLLQRPHTEAEGQQYLEVLNRQSMQLKKLIEDLIEMSKASTGNMSVEITQMDAIEAVNQALGEFSDKLERASLTPVFRHGAEEIPMLADGKLLWRVLHNLLSNAVKYALPGTRLYVDLMQLEGKVILSMKNVSRDELNVDAEELMERFVRGDGSRNTEGSGLGLNIAKSMMELQHGTLQLLVDGDLFKVTLIFPGVS